ncbi:DNA adenine methylase [Kushneria sp. Sum13]|uniref:DNA adenine methylase n=1 Tax=Kushneria sp. Sum13 TaxID=3459196 RepID=UPI0040456B8C
MSVVTRPILRYHGGKAKLAPWIISNLPSHRVYVEPFGGAASVLLMKPRAYAEVYNELDGEIVNLFRVARDRGAELSEALAMTPYSRAEFSQSYEASSDALEQARRTVVRAYMGFGSVAASGQATGFRANSNRSGTTPAHDWANYPNALSAVVERLRGVVIENRDAVDTILAHDGPDTLHYVDPPYLESTRSGYAAYRHELDDSQHVRLANALNEVEGMVVVSGYLSPLYEEIFAGWHCIKRVAFADGARERVEALWLNDTARARLNSEQFDMFGGAA